VFGFVYSGLDVGSAIAPVTVGLMLDHAMPRQALWLIAAMLISGVGIAFLLKMVSRPA
jgi:hypothetical protein